MKTLIVDNHTKNIDELKNLFKNSNVIKKEYFKKDLDVSEYDLVVFSGGSDVPTVLRHKDFYKDEIDFVKDIKKPVLGICLGFEIIAAAFGGRLFELDEEKRGVVDIKIKNEEIFEGKELNIKVYEAHTIGIKKAPDYFVELARSEHGIEIMLNKKNKILAIQFHPEIKNNSELLGLLLEKILS
ncbi:MAG: gamma-glutamyl-gamma-aminobutyrate hydrolase family protein [Candidatus Nomurabacteria bacterium]|nr:MAG: gamma-glutamyl-gamma-aminobutyrate hydrolase family protein [Candidatus Nomurabacteria bacterium]